MREIKFRAWNEKEKRMYTVLNLPLSNLSQQGLLLYAIEMDGIVGDKNTDDYKIMQFTGLRDKNGREIYEGDICAWNNWVVGSFAAKTHTLLNSLVVWSQADGAWVFDGNDTWNMAIYSNTEVVGNIYENPELISK